MKDHLVLTGIVAVVLFAVYTGACHSPDAQPKLEIVHLSTRAGHDFEVGKPGPGIETKVSAIYEETRFSYRGFVVVFPGGEIFVYRRAVDFVRWRR